MGLWASVLGAALRAAWPPALRAGAVCHFDADGTRHGNGQQHPDRPRHAVFCRLLWLGSHHLHGRHQCRPVARNAARQCHCRLHVCRRRCSYNCPRGRRRCHLLRRELALDTIHYSDPSGIHLGLGCSLDRRVVHADTARPQSPEAAQGHRQPRPLCAVGEEPGLGPRPGGQVWAAAAPDSRDAHLSLHHRLPLVHLRRLLREPRVVSHPVQRDARVEHAGRVAALSRRARGHAGRRCRHLAQPAALQPRARRQQQHARPRSPAAAHEDGVRRARWRPLYHGLDVAAGRALDRPRGGMRHDGLRVQHPLYELDKLPRRLLPALGVECRGSQHVCAEHVCRRPAPAREALVPPPGQRMGDDCPRRLCRPQRPHPVYICKVRAADSSERKIYFRRDLDDLDSHSISQKVSVYNNRFGGI